MKHKSSYSFAASLRAVNVVLVIVLFSLTIHAQTGGQTPVGLTPGSPTGSYPLSDFETINLFNGALEFPLALINIGGRGGAGYSLPLHYRAKMVREQRNKSRA
jgi:hypothetical protein